MRPGYLNAMDDLDISRDGMHLVARLLGGGGSFHSRPVRLTPTSRTTAVVFRSVRAARRFRVRC